MTKQIVPFRFETIQIRAVLNEDRPWFVAKDVASALGYSRTSDALEHTKNACVLPQLNQINGLAPATKWVAEADVYRMVMRSHMPDAERFQDWVVEDVLPSIRKTGHYDLVPDFSDPAAAARAWADAYEAKQLAQAKALQLERQIEEDRPYTEIAKVMTGDTTMFVRDWIAKMKRDHGNFIKEKKVREFLHDRGYWYWTQTSPRETRAYAKFDHLFKLEPERCSGVLRDVLKITGQGVLELTSVVVEHFRA